MPTSMEEFPPPQQGYDPKLQEVVPLGVEELTAAAEAAADAADELNAANEFNGAAAAASAGDPQYDVQTEGEIMMQVPAPAPVGLDSTREEEMITPAPVAMDSMSAFEELNGAIQPAPVDRSQQPPEQAGAEDAALFHPRVEPQYKTEEGYKIPEEQEYAHPQEQYAQEQPYTSTSVPVPPMTDDWNRHPHREQRHVAPTIHRTPAPPAQQPPPDPVATMELHSPIVAAPQIQPPEARTHPEHHGSEMYASYAVAPPGHPAHAAAAAPPPAMPNPYDPHGMYYPHPYAAPQAPAYAAPKPPPPPPGNHNSNFWLQEEEERFLLGLRLYGWGQWKRIQTVVQTRSNKQIKSHAQKREKVNPEIKFKYAKGKSRRGRISAKILAADYPTSVPPPEGDPSLPPMEELWKDVYGTNNGVGPNSRLRRYRSNALHQKWLEEVAEKPDAEQDALRVATEKKAKAPGADAKPEKPRKKLTPEGQYLMEHKVLERHAAPHPAPPVYGLPHGYYPPPHAYPHPGQPAYYHPPPGVSPPIMHPPPAAYHHPPPASYPPPLPRGHATAPHPPVVHRPAAAPAPAAIEEPLRPGMRVYARSKTSGSWCLGVIYSAKVDPNKTLDASQATVPLVYHVQYDEGEEDPEVQEECVIGKSKYEKAIEDLEAYYDLPPSSRGPIPLEAGLPVYAQWMESSNPTSHARWLPGTIGSVHSEESPSGPLISYHILFDNSLEKSVSLASVLDRNEYHESVKAKHAYADPSRTPIGEIYGMFSRGDQVGTSGQGMDLLFTASQMAAPMDTKKRGKEAVADPIAGNAKKIKVEELQFAENAGAREEEGAFTV